MIIEINTLIGIPGNRPANNTSNEKLNRRPSSAALEYYPLLHVQADERMTATIQCFMDYKLWEELHRQHEDSWSFCIAPLFNDDSFEPHPNGELAGVITLDYITMITPPGYLIHVTLEHSNESLESSNACMLHVCLCTTHLDSVILTVSLISQTDKPT